jgi:ketosteroid isomerase-like protein
MSRRDELKRLTDAWNDAWNSRDPSKLAAFFAADSTYYEPSLPAPEPGAAGVAAAAAKTWSEWPGVRFEQVSQTIDEPRVVLEWRSTARHKSGTVVELQGVDVLEWHGDRLRAARVYYDEHGRNRALGR